MTPKPLFPVIALSWNLAEFLWDFLRDMDFLFMLFFGGRKLLEVAEFIDLDDFLLMELIALDALGLCFFYFVFLSNVEALGSYILR
jgi:hypothetical protein